MVRKTRKAPSRSRSRATSRKVRNSTLGTHVTRTGGKSASSEPSFSNTRKNKRAQRGVVDQVLPSTSTRETRSEYARRTQKKTAHQDVKRRRTLQTVIAVLVVAFVAVGVVGFVGSTVFFSSSSGKMDLANENTTQALTSAADDAPYYVLIAGENYVPGQDYHGPGYLLLARVDEANKDISLMSVPSNVRVLLSDRNYHGISYSQILGDDAALISMVSEFAGVPISHYVKIDSKNFVELVDDLGGVEVMVKEEVDDPSAGVEYISPGQKTLTGKESLTFVRAKNYINGVQTQMDNQAAFFIALSQKLIKSGGLDRLFVLEAISSHIKTDLGADKISALADVFGNIDVSAIRIGKVPGFAGTDDTTREEFYFYSSDTWKAMMAAMDAGTSFDDVDPVVTVDPASFSITVRNGSGLTGGAQRVTEILSEQGFRVEGTGNADSYVYDETLVVYHDSAFRPAALAVADALGAGRAVASNGFYTFDTDVLVVFGADWKPLN